MGELRELNSQNKLAIWGNESRNAGTVARVCRYGVKNVGSVAKRTTNGKKRLYTIAEAQQGIQFAEVAASHTETGLALPGGITIDIRGANGTSMGVRIWKPWSRSFGY